MNVRKLQWRWKFVVSAVWVLGLGGHECLVADVPPAPGGPPESKEQHDARMAWWREAKFGLFIHWGLYSGTEGEWNGKEDYGEWIMCNRKIPVREYAGLAAKFNPVQWVSMAKNAWMKSIVITSKPHDGFAMFRPKADPFNICDATPFRRDPLQELAAACKKQGLRLGFCCSQAQDWHQPGADAVLGRRDNLQNGAFDKHLSKIVLPHLRELMTGHGPVAVLGPGIGGLEVTLSARMPDPAATVVVLNTEGP